MMKYKYLPKVLPFELTSLNLLAIKRELWMKTVTGFN